jgi:hypothetical protein
MPMTFFKRCIACVASLCIITAISSIDAAQGSAAGAPGPQSTAPAGAARGAADGRGGEGRGGRGAFIPEPVPPARNFATSTEHYEFLRQLHKGGTKHTYESIPKVYGPRQGTPRQRCSSKVAAGPISAREARPFRAF